MSTLDPRLTPILVAIVRAYLVELDDGRREPLGHMRTGGMREEVEHHAWPEDGPTVGRDELEELEELGAIRVERLQHWWRFKPSADGINSVLAYERELARAERPVGVDTSWTAVRPVLHALVKVWERNGASSHAVVSTAAVARELGRNNDDLGIVRALELLAIDEWVEAEYELGTDGPLGATPLPKALTGTRGWPGGAEAAAERFLSSLDDLVASETDESRRGVFARLRDTAMEVGTKTLAEVVSKSVGSAL